VTDLVVAAAAMKRAFIEVREADTFAMAKRSWSTAVFSIC
jgi:hypothetical protein